MRPFAPDITVLDLEGIRSASSLEKEITHDFRSSAKNLLQKNAPPNELDENEQMKLLAYLMQKYNVGKNKSNRKEIPGRDGYFRVKGLSYAIDKSIYDGMGENCIDFPTQLNVKLLNNPSAMSSVWNMWIAGGEPAVVGLTSDGGIVVIETNENPISFRQNCVYNEEGETELRKAEHNNGDGYRMSTGNAVAMAQKMGVEIMTKRIAETYMLPFEKINQSCSDILRHIDDDPDATKAPEGHTYLLDRCEGTLEIREVAFDGEESGINDYTGWRGMVIV